MDRFVSRLLAISLTACGVSTDLAPDLSSLHAKGTTRRCLTRIDLRATGEALSGSRGDSKRYPPARRFSDGRIKVEWLLEPRALYADITNETEAAITVESVSVGYEKVRAATPPTQLGPGSGHRVRLLPLGDSEEFFNTEKDCRPVR